MEYPGTIDIDSLRKQDKTYGFKNSVVPEYSKWLYNNDYSPGTSREYCRHIDKLLGKEGKISIVKIKDYLNNKKNKTTIAYSSIKLFLKFLDDKFEINFPFFNYPRFKAEKKDRPTPPNKEEIKLVIEEFRKDFENTSKDYRIYDYTLFIETMFRMGNRISEVIKLRTGNVRWKEWLENKESWGRIAYLKSKGKISRVSPCPPNLMEKLYVHVIKEENGIFIKDNFLFDFGFQRYRGLKFKKWKSQKKALIEGDERSEEYLLNAYIKKCSNDIERRLKELSKKCLGREINSHSLRAAKATDLDNSKVGVSKIRDLLGHANIATTSLYIRNKYETLEEELKEKDSF